MTPREVAAAVREWFGAVAYAGLVLPDGWFGRPYDSLLPLTDVQVLDDGLLVELDDRLRLTFRGDLACAADGEDGADLAISATAIAFGWREHGSDRPRSDAYDGGTVRLVSMARFAPPRPE